MMWLVEQPFCRSGCTERTRRSRFVSPGVVGGEATSRSDVATSSNWSSMPRWLSSRFSAYRFHDEDPIFFQSGLRLTCRCGETEHGRADEKMGYLDPTKTRYTTYTWVYQW